MSEKTIKLLNNNSGEPGYIYVNGGNTSDYGLKTGILIGTVEVVGYTEDDIDQTYLYIDYKASPDSDWERLDISDPEQYYLRNGFNGTDTYKMTGKLYKGKYISIIVNGACLESLSDEGYDEINIYENKIIFGIDVMGGEHREIEILHYKPYRYTLDGDNSDSLSPCMSGTLSFPSFKFDDDTYGFTSAKEYLDDEDKVTITNALLTAGFQPEDVSIRYGVAKLKVVPSESGFKTISEPMVWSDRINPEEFVYTDLSTLNDNISPGTYDYVCLKNIDLDFSDSALGDLDILEDEGISLTGYIVVVGSSIYCRDGIDGQYFMYGIAEPEPRGVGSYENIGLGKDVNIGGHFYVFKDLPF